MRQKDQTRSLKNKIARRIIKILLVIFLIICVTEFMNWLTEGEGSWKPDYPKSDLGSIVLKTELSESDYHTIFVQTGLERGAADILLRENSGADRVRIFQKYQDNFFSSGNYECRISAFIVHDERIRDENGKLVEGFELLDVRTGDIFITKATHSLGWRHGHAALITDAEKGETLEAIRLGNPAILQRVEKWRTYPSFIHLRLKDYETIDADKLVEYAKEEMLGIPYGLLTGIPVKAPDDVKKTQCSHLVWYPYERFGYDLDSDGSWLVTPKDIANSELLEVVQVYGVDPEAIWP